MNYRYVYHLLTAVHGTIPVLRLEPHHDPVQLGHLQPVLGEERGAESSIPGG